MKGRYVEGKFRPYEVIGIVKYRCVGDAPFESVQSLYCKIVAKISYSLRDQLRDRMKIDDGDRYLLSVDGPCEVGVSGFNVNFRNILKDGSE